MFLQCLKPLFRKFLTVVSLFTKKACLGKPLQDRERDEREGSVISVGESMSRTCRRNSIRSHSLLTHREFYSDERDLREDLERRAQQAVLGENSAQRKLYLTEHDMEIRNLERKNAEYLLLSRIESLNLNDDNYWKPINGRIKLSVREHTCVANWR